MDTISTSNQKSINTSSFEFSGYVFREDSFGIIKRLHFLIDHIEKTRSRLGLNTDELNILDVGCGTGIAITIPVAKCGYQIKGIDIDKASINKAKSITENIDNISFSCQELAALDGHEQFHIIICSEVLEHIEKPDEILKQMQKMLVDDGVLLVTVPNGYGYFELESLVYERYPDFVSYIDLCQQAFVERYCSEALQERHETERSKDYCDMACPSLDEETFHCNKFTARKIRQLLQTNSYKIIEFNNRTILAGNIINVLLRESDTLLRWNGKIANYLPKWMCSDWMIASVKSDLSG